MGKGTGFWCLPMPLGPTFPYSAFWFLPSWHLLIILPPHPIPPTALAGLPTFPLWASCDSKSLTPLNLCGSGSKMADSSMFHTPLYAHLWQWNCVLSSQNLAIGKFLKLIVPVKHIVHLITTHDSLSCLYLDLLALHAFFVKHDITGSEKSN